MAQEILLTKEQAIEKAEFLVNFYSEFEIVEDVIEQAIADGKLKNDVNTTIVYGRLMRLLPNRLGTNGVK
jgi:hypothetical protein